VSSEFAAFQDRFGQLLVSDARSADPALRRALAVHRNTATKAALDALAANFPVTTRLVGAEAFQACAHDFVVHRPPAEPRLCLYGERFASQVAAWHAFADFPYLGSVASLERLVVEALFAADVTPLDPTVLSAGVDGEMPLALHPATRHAQFKWPAVTIWQAHQGDEVEGLTITEWTPEAVLVTRPAHRVEVRAIDPATHAFLTSPTLGEAAAAAHALGGDVAEIFSSLLLSGAFA
jgi:hypothetical protein